MIHLYRKELRALVPLFFLSFLLVSGDVLYRPFTERLDESSWADISAIEPGSQGELAFAFFVLAFIVAFAAFPREHDEGTMEYLRSLPIRPRSIFAAKVLAGITVLSAVAVLGQVTNWMLQAPNVETLEGGQFRLGLSLRISLVESVFMAVAYAHSLLASALRRFGLLPLILAIWALEIVTEVQPSLAWLHPISIVRLTYHGQALVMPWWEMGVHLGLACVSLGLAYFAWMGPLDVLRDALAPREGRSGVVSLAFGCATAAVVFVGLVFVVFLVVRGADGSEGAPQAAEYVSFQTADASTEHYVFTYPVNLRARAMRLVGEGDAIWEGVRETLGASAEGPPISVDLAETSGHHEGIAAGSRIRMGIVGRDEARLTYVLAHESTHVFQGRESDQRLMTMARAGRFFSEGSAEWVAHEVVDGAELRAASRVVAAASWERQRLRFEDVVDEERLHARFDTSLVYSMGETWTEAVARACGREAVGGLARSLARADRAEDLAPVAVWQDALQHVGCGLEEVDAAWVGLLREIAVAERAAIDALPRMGAGVRRDPDGRARITVALDRDASEALVFTVRLRRDRSAADTELRGAECRLVGARVAEVALVGSMIPDARFEVQACVSPPGTTWTFCEEWQAASW